MKGNQVVFAMFFLLFFCIFNFQSSAYGAGLGDTVESINKQYHKKITVQEMDYFGKPPRASALAFNTKGFFGALPNNNPDNQQFFKGIRQMIPTDAKLTSSYQKNDSWLKEYYVFKSNSLKKVPDIRSAITYQKDMLGSPMGTFYIIVNHDVDNAERVANCLISLGLPNNVDLSGAKRINKNPFK